MQKIIVMGVVLITIVALYFLEKEPQENKTIADTSNPKVEQKVASLSASKPKPKEKPHSKAIPKQSKEKISQKSVEISPMSSNVSDETKRESDKKSTISEIKQDIPQRNDTEIKRLQPMVLEEMKKIPDCLENAFTKEEAFKCSHELREVNQKMMLAMGHKTLPEMKGFPNNFVWNEDKKIEMIQQIEGSIAPMEKAHYCIQNTKTQKEFAECINLRPDKNKPKLEDLNSTY